MAASGLTGTGALASIIALLPAQVQDVVASLPDEDQEVFSYMVSHSVDGTSSSSGKKKQAQRQQNAAKSGKRNSVAHERAFGCSCFDCYSGYWSLWGASSNKEVIQEAIELNESLAVQAQAEAGTGRRSAWPMGKSRGSKDGPNKQKRGKEKTNVDKGKSKKKGKGSKESSVMPDSTPTVLENLGSAAGEASQESEVKEKSDQECSQTDPTKEEKNAEKKASKKQKDGIEKKEVGVDGGQEKGKAEPVCKPRSKQVAPLDFKEESAIATALQVQEIPIAAEAGKTASLGSRASDAVGFVCDKLLGMWYPRLRRRS